MTNLNDQSEQAEFLADDSVLLNPSSKTKRFINYIVDLTCIFIFGYFIGLVLGYFVEYIPGAVNALVWASELGKIGNYLIGMLLMMLYYPFFEAAFGYTPGKLVTNTKVVTEDGLKPTFFKIIKRTLCRFIPFDHLSFLNDDAVGWHDNFSQTRVVNETSRRKMLVPITLIIIILSLGAFAFLQDEGVIDLYQDTADSNMTTVSYKGISFSCSDNWKVEKTELEENLGYQISCEKKGGHNVESLSIVYLDSELDLREWLINSIEALKTESVYKNAQFEEISETNFLGLQAYSVDFSWKLFEEKFYGQIIVFFDKGKSIMYLKQAGSEDSLENSFRIIENSLKIE